MVYAILFVFGAIVGSFLNVVASRWDTGEVFGGRSKCPSCQSKLKWFELVPIASFIIQRAKCRECGTKISFQYPIVEIFTGLVFISVPLWILPVFSIYIVILIYDLHYKIIPDTLVYTAILLSVVSRLAPPELGGVNLLVSSTLDWLAGPILFAFFALIWLMTRGKAMGFGDAKLGLSVGLLLGAAEGFSAIVLAFWIGAFGSLLYIFLNRINFLKSAKKLTMKSEIPFAPFIIVGAWISLVFKLNLLHVLSF